MEIYAALKKLKEENKKLKESNLQWKALATMSDSEEEDFEYNSDGEPLTPKPKDKYEASDDWLYGYGFTTKDGEYRISMCGGCAEWFDYVIKKDGCFIHNKDGMKKVRTFISCPEGNYLKVVELGDPDYKLDEGETDMFEMVKECFKEKIMEYEADFDPYQYGDCENCGIPLTEDDHENGEGKCEDCCQE